MSNFYSKVVYQTLSFSKKYKPEPMTDLDSIIAGERSRDEKGLRRLEKSIIEEAGRGEQRDVPDPES